MTMSVEEIRMPQTLLIILLGFIAFIFGAAGGVIFGKIMCCRSGWKIISLIGVADVSAVPMIQQAFFIGAGCAYRDA